MAPYPRFFCALFTALLLWRPAEAYYAATNVTETAEGVVGTLVLRSGFYPEFGADIATLQLEVLYESDSHLRVRITDPSNQRWEVPKVLQESRLQKEKKALNYKFEYTADPFDFRVVRLSDQEVIFDTNIFERLIFKDQYIEISTVLPQNANIYGLGERISNFRLDNNNRIYSLFAADNLTPQDGSNLYSSNPFYLETRSGRRSHGVFMLNSNGMDVDLRADSLSFKMIGGIIDLFFFVGPAPEQVVQQLSTVIGRPYFQPYWVLGFHQCKWGYENLTEVRDVVANYKNANIPLDTMWTDIDYMDRYRDWTFDADRFPRDQVVEFANELVANGQHYMLILDPAIYDLDGTYEPYTNGLAKNIYIMNAEGTSPYRGSVWPGSTVFPDFTHPNTSEWWYEENAKWMDGLNIGGLWIDMNEPANFEFSSMEKATPTRSRNANAPDYNNPPYAIDNHGFQAPLRRKTIEMDSLHYGNQVHYNQHNLYGHFESIATREAADKLFGKRSLVVSRSTFPGSGAYVATWGGDNVSAWSDLAYSIPGILSFSLVAQALSGMDICGFFDDTTEELCARWMSLGAFYPFARNHNHEGQMPQEPYRFPVVAEASRRALATRYRILPYFYTLFYHANQYGNTVTRPMFFEFDTESDADLLYFDRQFLLGPAILVSPVLTQGATTLEAFFPRSARWYNITDGKEQPSGWQTLSVPVTDIAVHLRGGYVLPTQDAALTTTAARLTPFTIIFALNSAQAATGDLFLDDGESFDTFQDGQYTLIDFVATAGRASADVVNGGYAPSARLASIKIWGVTLASISSVTFNGASVPFTFQSGVLSVTGLSQAMTSGWDLQYSS